MLLAGRRRTEERFEIWETYRVPVFRALSRWTSYERSRGNRVAASEGPAAAPSATSNIIQGKLRRVDKAIIRAAARFDGTMAFVEYKGEKGLRQTVVWKINVLGLNAGHM